MPLVFNSAPISQFPKDVLPSSQIFIQNEQHSYEFVSPDTKISELHLSTQQHVLVVPEIFDLTITNPSGQQHTLKVRNNYILGDVIKQICIKSQLLDSKFYQVKTKDKTLDQI
jgi:hypothetical protein